MNPARGPADNHLRRPVLTGGGLASGRGREGDRMIASLKGYGKIARALLAALGVFLILGIAGSMWMGSKARTSARDEIVHQAQAITDSSLSLAFQPSDLSD